MPADAYSQSKTALLALDGHRVWSLMATLFGDLAQEEGSTVNSVEYVVVAGENLIRVEGVEEGGAPFIALLDFQTGEVSAMIDPATGNIMEEGEYEE